MSFVHAENYQRGYQFSLFAIRTLADAVNTPASLLEALIEYRDRMLTYPVTNRDEATDAHLSGSLDAINNAILDVQNAINNAQADNSVENNAPRLTN